MDAVKEEPAKQAPQPKWTYFKFLNVLVPIIFMGTFLYVAWNYRQRALKASAAQHSPITNMYFPAMVIFSLCMVYFFGFFGISFLDTDAIAKSPSSYGMSDLPKKLAAEKKKIHRVKSVTFAEEPPKLRHRHDTTSCEPVKSAQEIVAEAMAKAGVPIDYRIASDEQVFEHLKLGTLKDYQLEKALGNYERAVLLRRMLYEHTLKKKFDTIPYKGYDYRSVYGANCEIVVGYVPLPVGIVGPLLLNGEPIYVPMATTEGCLVASTNRGCKAISAAGGCFAAVLKDAITRAPCVKMPSAMRAAALKGWIEIPENYALVEAAFNSTTNYGRLESVEATIAGSNVYLRFSCTSGDAMGMNMVSKGCLTAIELLEKHFTDLTLVAISGNMCTDKKPAAINWILGRGKSVVVEAVIPEKIVSSVLKCTVNDIIETNKQKNHIGSAMAGSVGGFNAHAANIVTALFLATGQDPAQNVESSNCITIMDYAEDGKSLQISVTMPSIEVGTVGGGTHLPAQAGCLDILGVRGASVAPAQPGDNARRLAVIIGATVLAGELSLMAALAANHLVRSHMQHNRKPTDASSASATRDHSKMPRSLSDEEATGEIEDAKGAPGLRRNSSLPTALSTPTGSSMGI